MASDGASTHRANSLHYVWVRALPLPAPKGAPCPLRDAPPDAEPARRVYVRLPERVLCFETTSEDFSLTELSDLKDRSGQLYADVSRKVALDDFARDLTKLRRAADCGACARRPACGTAWEPVARSVFAPFEAELDRLLASLRGAVLDVGCGGGRSLGALAPAAEQGVVTYTGVEPSAEQLAVLAARWPWARLVLGTLASLTPHAEADAENGAVRAFSATAETADAADATHAGADALAPARFDAALLLRSFNHLPDPLATAERLHELLAPHGQLIAVDGVAFALLRTREQAARAERSQAVREHYRNATGTEAARCFETAGFEVTRLDEVTPETGPEWLLVAQRRD